MNIAELTRSDREVLRAAIEASDRLYVAGIQEVGAAVGTGQGRTFAAIGFDTATGFANVCGEVAALCCMVASGQRDVEVVAAVWRDRAGQHYLLPPCGRCREVISDFNPDAWVIVTKASDHWDASAITDPVKVRVTDLLPRRSHQLRIPQ